MPFDVHRIREQFPILNEKIEGLPLIYLDNAATTQKPQSVLNAEHDFYRHANANINRGVHVLAERATIAFDHARTVVQHFIGARHPYEIIFTGNTTEAINLVAKTWGKQEVHAADTIVLTLLEHHSNIVPWQQLVTENGCAIEWLTIDDSGQPDLNQLEKILGTRCVKLVAISALSNVLGTMPPLARIIEMAHAKGAKVLVDAAQYVAHKRINVQELSVDFLAFSSHKTYGPTGIGALYGKAELLEAMPPFLGGGDMISSVTQQGFTPAELPRKFEAGTPAIAEAIGFAAAVDWLYSIDHTALETHESALLAKAFQGLQSMSGIRVLGPQDAAHRSGCISFVAENIHAHDLTEILGRQGICLRAGHHCTQPLHDAFGIAASSRLSVAAYNTIDEIDQCLLAIEQAKKTSGMLIIPAI